MPRLPTLSTRRPHVHSREANAHPVTIGLLGYYSSSSPEHAPKNQDASRLHKPLHGLRVCQQGTHPMTLLPLPRFHAVPSSAGIHTFGTLKDSIFSLVLP